MIGTQTEGWLNLTVTDDNEDQGNKSIYVDVQYGAPDCLWEDAKEQIDK